MNVLTAIVVSVGAAVLGGGAGAAARRLVGGWTVPLRPHERDALVAAHNLEIKDLEAHLAAAELEADTACDECGATAATAVAHYCADHDREAS